MKTIVWEQIIRQSSNNEVELANISSDEDNEFVPIKNRRLTVLNYSSDTNTE